MRNFKRALAIMFAAALAFVLFASAALAAEYIGQETHSFTYGGYSRHLYSNLNAWKSGSTGYILSGGHSTFYALGAWQDWYIPAQWYYGKITNPAGKSTTCGGESTNVSASSRSTTLSGGSGTWKCSGYTEFDYAAPYAYTKSYSGTFS
jgi:hypothetical protein